MINQGPIPRLDYKIIYIIFAFRKRIYNLTINFRFPLNSSIHYVNRSRPDRIGHNISPRTQNAFDCIEIDRSREESLKWVRFTGQYCYNLVGINPKTTQRLIHALAYLDSTRNDIFRGNMVV